IHALDHSVFPVDFGRRPSYLILKCFFCYALGFSPAQAGGVRLLRIRHHGRLRRLGRRARRGRVWQASLGSLLLLLGSRLLLLSSLHSRLLFRRLKRGAVLIYPQYILPVPERLGNQGFTAGNEV